MSTPTTRWQERAACVGEDPQLFFPDGNGIQAYRKAEQAITICRSCPVIAQCEQYRRDTHSQFGVWAGRNHFPRPPRRRRAA